MKANYSPLRFAILAVGSELLDGRVLDTNSQFVARELDNYGSSLVHVLSCDDIIADIKQCLVFLSKHAELILISGGLGPTTDDLTREAVAELTGDILESRETEIAHLRELYATKKRELDPSNIKQASFPSRARALTNELGTAPGFWTNYTENGSSVQLVALPGVPREFKQMFLAHLRPYLESQKLARLEKHSFHLFGLPEAGVNTRLQSVKLPAGIVTSYRAAFPEIHVGLKNVGAVSDFTTAVNDVRAAIDPQFVFSEASLENTAESLPQKIHALLVERHVTVATAESCTGGLVAKLLTDLPGASSFYLGGVSCYSNNVKQQLLGVSADSLASAGAVSATVAHQLASGVRKLVGSDYALSITGIAGPDGGVIRESGVEKPVGTFFIGLATPDTVSSYKFFFSSTRDWIRQYSAYTALDLLRRALLKLPLPEPIH